MLVPRILKKLQPVYFGTMMDSGLRRAIIKSKTFPSREVLTYLGLEPYRCSCDHDCCGHTQYSRAIVERRNKRNEWYVTQHFYRNV